MAAKKTFLTEKNKPWIAFILIIAIAVVSWAAVSTRVNFIMQPQILVIPVRGDISLYGSGSLFGDSGASADRIVAQIQEANSNPLVSAIILEINSNGGTVVASEEISRAIEASKKPVVAWIREAAASGGYFIASSCDKIVADPASITGSIGVTASYLQYSNLMEKYGVTYERLVTGQYKDIGTPYKGLTESERALMESKINSINEMFIRHISRTRNLPSEDVRKIATGEIILGIEAQELGLVDLLGSSAEAKAVAERLAGIKNAKLVASVQKQSFLVQLLKDSIPFSSYDVGRGIGDSLTATQDFSLRA